MEPCRFAIRERHRCVDSQGRPVHGDQVCFYEAVAQLCDERAEKARAQRPPVLAGKDLAVGS